MAADFATSAVVAGWVLAGIAAVTALTGLGALLRAALRGGDETPKERPGVAADVQRARDRWQQALLERGVLPYLRHRLPEALAP